MTGRRGFTLLELIVATTILAVAVVGLMSGVTGSMRNASRLRDTDHVTQAARERMNELLADYTAPRDTEIAGPFDPASMGGVEAGWRAKVSTAEASPGPGGQLALDRIALEVWWNVNGTRRTMMLEGFRKRHLLQGEQ